MGSFSVDHPAVIRARAFKSGSIDRLGARTVLWGTTQSINETFDREPDGCARSRMQFSGDTISLVTDPVRPGAALRFNDDGTSGNPYQPFGYYSLIHGQRGIDITFDVWLEAGAELMVQWADDDKSAPGIGSRIVIQGDGQVVSPDDGVNLGVVRLNKWTTLSLRIPFDADHSALLKIGDKRISAFAGSAAAKPVEFVQRILFCSSGKEPADFLIDNVKIESLENDQP
jgi:hypothetical protein